MPSQKQTSEVLVVANGITLSKGKHDCYILEWSGEASDKNISNLLIITREELERFIRFAKRVSDMVDLTLL